MCHSSTHPGTSYHVTQFYQAFPRVNTASDERWGEKPGYEANPTNISTGHFQPKTASRGNSEPS